jgi:hypothetical protein
MLTLLSQHFPQQLRYLFSKLSKDLSLPACVLVCFQTIRKNVASSREVRLGTPHWKAACLMTQTTLIKRQRRGYFVNDTCHFHPCASNRNELAFLDKVLDLRVESGVPALHPLELLGLEIHSDKKPRSKFCSFINGLK